ncbi:bifunctional phosphopantothenoylcysteine decarboxylase/phosphopantothenate--cysteine ligase CoaBC [Pseudoroseomonas cervicalis]|uniref:bifunctional phosphopantothenoylcysteine decarboxylase/phosphopantothenate--cysteine ligase CoaBC n=1 Tax=Teichococcus cervicalis TaxID=204525 RepID=UPI0022F1AAE2|nr:bifunctional phosphopantothenoylcysteine decarboxylase/phosphopantothenate--cysteine ligase CoaBC [Pseudoroseomonas cervicalis]WBV43010.1 bifunctional phosphopantothenoylcysteine decarboxylase/phosphopantothenate--cysteine ligase CoaBC [Pseudoroseomonas cervicalis]
MPAGKHVLLVVSGSVSAYKALELTRLLRKAGARVTPVLTAGGARFVTPNVLQAIAGEPVHQDLWSLQGEADVGHIRLARMADLVAVVPASADFLAKMAHGLADDLASTVLLATDRPVLVAPAMNWAMWAHPATRANMAALASRGVQVIGPNDGAMAEAESGPGRLAEPAEILAAIEALLDPGAKPLAGRHILVTSGPTHEPIDPVRYIANRSSGKQGHAIAAALAALGARVTLVSGPVTLPDPPGVTTLRIESAREMLAACEAALPADAAVCAAAVADWRSAGEATQKLKKIPGEAPPPLALTLNPDILATLSRHARRPTLVVGFAAETENVIPNAIAKRQRKGCDWIVANDVSGDVMGGAENAVHIVTETGVEDWPRLPKPEVAARLATRIAEFFA